MSGESSSAAEWFTRLEPAVRPDFLPRRPDDPRLGEVVEFWDGDPAAIRPGRAVLIGFPQDEGVRPSGGRPGAAEAPARDTSISLPVGAVGRNEQRATFG
jgi:hypothetical protein